MENNIKQQPLTIVCPVQYLRYKDGLVEKIISIVKFTKPNTKVLSINIFIPSDAHSKKYHHTLEYVARCDDETMENRLITIPFSARNLTADMIASKYNFSIICGEDCNKLKDAVIEALYETTNLRKKSESPKTIKIKKCDDKKVKYMILNGEFPVSGALDIIEDEQTGKFIALEVNKKITTDTEKNYHEAMGVQFRARNQKNNISTQPTEASHDIQNIITDTILNFNKNLRSSVQSTSFRIYSASTLISSLLYSKK